MCSHREYVASSSGARNKRDLLQKQKRPRTHQDASSCFRVASCRTNIYRPLLVNASQFDSIWDSLWRNARAHALSNSLRRRDVSIRVNYCFFFIGTPFLCLFVLNWVPINNTHSLTSLCPLLSWFSSSDTPSIFVFCFCQVDPSLSPHSSH